MHSEQIVKKAIRHNRTGSARKMSEELETALQEYMKKHG
jgi:hypothetical protein